MNSLCLKPEFPCGARSPRASLESLRLRPFCAATASDALERLVRVWFSARRGKLRPRRARFPSNFGFRVGYIAVYFATAAWALGDSTSVEFTVAAGRHERNN